MTRKHAKGDRSPRARKEKLEFRQVDLLTLSNADQQAFFDALIYPAKPSERLVRALAEHKRRIAQ